MTNDALHDKILNKTISLVIFHIMKCPCEQIPIERLPYNTLLPQIDHVHVKSMKINQNTWRTHENYNESFQQVMKEGVNMK